MRLMKTYKMNILNELIRQKSGLIGLLILVILITISIYAVTTIPLPEAIKMWRSTDKWVYNPKNAMPEWFEIFYGKKLPRTIIVQVSFNSFVKERLNEGKYKVKGILCFEYPYDDFPSEINIFFTAKYKYKAPTISIYWVRPDGSILFLRDYTLRMQDDRYYLSNDLNVEARLFDVFIDKIGKKPNFVVTVERGLFANFSADLAILKGQYRLILEAVLSEGEGINATLVVYGIVHGFTGTDHCRRPLSIALLWGAPIALSFGLLAAVLTTALNLIIGTISGWYGGTVDMIIQRIVEINTIIPFLPVLILLSTLYKLDISLILLSIIILNIFSIGTKNIRVLVMQLSTSSYIEAAKAYGASNLRIIFIYIIPKILPSIVPGIISSVPNFVFLEAALSYLGLGDPFLPTWGKVISDAFSNGAFYKGYYYWILEPVFMLVITALSFSLIGSALEKIVNPRLKEL